MFGLCSAAIDGLLSMVGSHLGATRVYESAAESAQRRLRSRRASSNVRGSQLPKNGWHLLGTFSEKPRKNGWHLLGWKNLGKTAGTFSAAPSRLHLLGCTFSAASLEEAQAWVDGFVAWYNTEHLHSALRFVTPDDRHYGREEALLERRKEVYEEARRRHPERWARHLRNWQPVGDVFLNPTKERRRKKTDREEEAP